LSEDPFGRDNAAGTDDTAERLISNLRRPTIPALDGVRAVAVTLVLYYHMRVSPVFDGPLGVLIFFTLSGFLITWLLLKEHQQASRIDIVAFYKRRTLRIFPAFYCFWLFIICANYLRGTPTPWSQAWSSFFYLSNYHHAIFRPQPEFIMHTWSLAVEEQFYLLWPAIFVYGAAGGTAGLVRMLTALIAFVWMYRIVLWYGWHCRDYLSYAFEARMDALLVGCLAAVLVARNVGARWWLPLARLRPIWGAAALVTTILLERQFGNDFRFTVGLALQPLLAAAWMLQLVAHADTGMGRVFSSHVASYIGRISYPLYLYHGIGVWASSPFASFLPARMAIAALVAVAVASVSYWLVERPFLALKNRPLRDWFRWRSSVRTVPT
jgi:peptidoglycan/LPS O-acetylase OafA/YrhL